MYLSIYVCPQNVRRCKPPGNRLTTGVEYLTTAHVAGEQTAGERNTILSASLYTGVTLSLIHI